MQKSVEFRGKTTDEALASGLKQLGLERDDVSVEIVERGKKGVFGIGAVDAVVRVTYEAPGEEPAPAPVKTEAPKAAPAPAPKAAPAVTGAGEPVTAPMPGTILKVNVSANQAVKAGTVLCILEAMKMENEIMAPKDGTVTQVLVSKGSTVDTGAPLVVIG